jgi:hypothetical protein
VAGINSTPHLTSQQVSLTDAIIAILFEMVWIMSSSICTLLEMAHLSDVPVWCVCCKVCIYVLHRNRAEHITISL